MINSIKKKIINRIYRKFFQKAFNPRKEFLETSKNLFLRAVTARVGVKFEALPVRSSFYQHPMRYAIYAAAILIFSTTSLAAYADYQDVPPTHPLYGLKRLGENFQLAIASDNQKALFNEKYAKRRLQELEKAEEINVDHSEDKINQVTKLKEELKNDLQKRVEAIETAASEKDNEKDAGKEAMQNRLPGLCESESQIITNGEAENFWKKSEKLSKFKNRCEKLKEADQNEQVQLESDVNSFENNGDARDNIENEIDNGSAARIE